MAFIQSNAIFAPTCPAARRRGLWDYLGLIRQRRDLARLTDDQLHDMGLTRDAAEAEAARPVWDVPAHWR